MGVRPDHLKPAAVLAERYDHGARMKYVGGCRCLKCRAANSNYETQRAELRRQGLGDPVVPAKRTRARLRRLSDAGVGYKRVAEVSGCSKTVLFKIMCGTKTRCRKSTERAVFKVKFTDKATGALVDASAAWEIVQELQEEGWTKTAIARAMGANVRALQIGKNRVRRVTVDKLRTILDLHYQRVRMEQDGYSAAQIAAALFPKDPA